MSKFLRMAACLPLCVGVLASAAADQKGRLPPLEVRSSTPTEGETDVRLDTVVRIQFSNPVDPRSLDERIRMHYSKEESAERGEAQPPSIAFESRYLTEARALELRPARPLERFRNVTVELLHGIAGTDGSVMSRWRLQFMTGGS